MPMFLLACAAIALGLTTGLTLPAQESHLCYENRTGRPARASTLTDSPFVLYSVPLPQHTAGHRNCGVCEQTRKLLMPEQEYPDMTIREAGPAWLESRRFRLSAKSLESYTFYLKALIEFFGQIPLRDINPGHLREYQKWRLRPREQQIKQRGGTTRKAVTSAGPSTINHELNTLQQVMQRAKLWGALADYYEPLPLPRSEFPKSLTEQQEDHLFEIAAKNPEWLVAYCCSSITVNTTASGVELKRLLLKHVDLYNIVVRIPADATKGGLRPRVIPLNEIAEKQFRRLLARANECGSWLPDHHVLPFRVKRNEWDPLRPMTSWRTAFRKMRKAAGLPQLQPHHLRHHAITKLLQNPNVSEQTAIEISGHRGRRMLMEYSWQRLQAKKEALAAIAAKPPQPSRGTMIPMDVKRKARGNSA